MNFLEKMRNALIRFMYGRNGLDYLNQMLFRVLLVVYILALFIREGVAGALLSWAATFGWVPDVPDAFPEPAQASGGKPEVCKLVVGHQK